MELNGKPVSPRFEMQGVFVRVDEGEEPVPWRKLVFATPLGQVRCKFTDDIPDLEPGAAYRFFLRLIHPEFKRPKFERSYICDGVEVCNII